MIISLIGMSNSGKTYWAKKLEKAGFIRFSCDDFIATKLENELKNEGFSGIADVAKWLGQPYDVQYSRTSGKYLEFEKESLGYIIDKIKNNAPERNLVIDTTGSVIYTGDKFMRELQNFTRILYLETPSMVRDHMCNMYFQNPKPVIWGKNYRKQNGESDAETLKICYPGLLDYRCKIYKQYAHVTLDYFFLRKAGFTTRDFLSLISK